MPDDDEEEEEEEEEEDEEEAKGSAFSGGMSAYARGIGLWAFTCVDIRGYHSEMDWSADQALTRKHA